jgi:hypothetical protein
LGAMLNQARADARERPRIGLDIGRGHGACDRHGEPVQRAKEFGEVSVAKVSGGAPWVIEDRKSLPWTVV